MDVLKTKIHAKEAALALLFLTSLSIAENLTLPVSVLPNQTQASQAHYNRDTPFNITLFVNATNNELLWCNASVFLNDTGINLTASADRSNLTYIGNVTNQSIANATWSLTAPGRGAHYLNFSLSCNGTNYTANTTVYVDLLNVTNVSLTTYATKSNDSYFEVYRNSSYNISIAVASLDPTQSLTNVVIYLNGTNSSAYTLNSTSQQATGVFNASAANYPVGAAYSYVITTNDTQGDRWTQPLVITVKSPLNVSVAYNDSAIVANQSFTATATATNLGPGNLTNVNLSMQYDGGLALTNASCQQLNLTPGNSSTACVWTFNSTAYNPRANITVGATTQEGDNNTYAFSARIYGIGSFTPNASISFGTYNHSKTAIQGVILNASQAEDIINFNCNSTNEANYSLSCQSLANLTKSATASYNLSLTIPQYTPKGLHNGSVTIWAENANPQTLNYSVNVTGVKKCSGTPTYDFSTRPSGSTGLITGLTVNNNGNVPVNLSCTGGGCGGVLQAPSQINPGTSVLYNISVNIYTTSTGVTINCTSADPEVLDGGSTYLLSVTYPAAATTTTTTTTTTTSQPQVQIQSNATTYTYTVGILPASATANKGESADFTIEVKNTGTGTLSNLTVSGESTLQFSVTPTRIASIPKGQAGYAKITATTTSSTAAGTYKIAAKVCRAASCVTSAESSVTVPDDTPPPQTAPPENLSVAEIPAVAQEPAQNATLKAIAEDNAIRLRIDNATNADNVTTYIEVLDLAGKVVYNATKQVRATNGSANYDLSIPETLKAGNYTLRIAVRDLAGNTIAEKTLNYTARERMEPPKTGAALTAKLSPGVINGLLLIIIALFVIAGIKTSTINVEKLKTKLNIRQTMLKKAQTAYAQGDYGKAKEYKATAETASKAELDLTARIGDSEKRIIRLYKEGRHLQARKEQENLSRMKKELESIREQHGK